MKILFQRVLLGIVLIFLVACSSAIIKPGDTDTNVVNKVLVADGYSRLSGLQYLTRDQNRIAIEQAAKLNAYRSLAKQIYSEKLTDNLNVANQVLKNELYRVYLDLYLREARVVTSSNVADQQKITLALDLSPRFYQCFSSTIDVVSKCLYEDNKLPFTRIGYQQAALTTVDLSCATSDCADQLSMSGFSSEKSLIDRTMLDFGLYDAEWTVNLASKALLRYIFLHNYVFD